MIHTVKGKNGTAFYLNGRLVGTALAAPGCTDRFIREDDGCYRWERIAEHPVSEMEMAFDTAYPMGYQMIPARMYNQNISHEITSMSTDIWDKQGHKEEKEPSYPVGCIDPIAKEVRKFAWWRSSIPGGAYTEGDGLSVGTFLPPDQRDASFSITPNGADTVHTYYWPVAEGPRIPEAKPASYHRPPAYKDEDVSFMFQPAKMGGPYRLSIEPRTHFAVMLVFAPADTPKTAWHKLLSSAWKVNYSYRAPKFDNDELWEMGVEFTKSMYCEGENGFHGFTLGKVFIDGEWIHRPYYRYEMGWTGQGIALGANMLYEAIRSGDKEAEEMGFTALDSWLAAALPNEMLPTHIMGQQFPCNGREVVDACNLSAGALGYFRAWDYAQVLGKPRPEYFDAALKLCDFTLEKMSPEGKLAKTWYADDLTPAAENGSTGAFLILPLCEAAKRTHKPEYLEGAVRCYRYYYNEFMENGYSFGGAQDKFSIDKESGIPMLRAALALYELTGEQNYITCAKDGAYYLSTWQWQHTHPLMPDSELGRIGYDTFGGTSVSINGYHPDNDPYALPYIHDLYDLSELTGEPEWSQRAHAAWLHSCQGLSDGTLVVGGIPIPRGGQDEAYGMGRPYEDSGFAWMPGWMNCFRMENILRTLPGGDRPGRVL